MKIRKRAFSGMPTVDVQKREIINREKSRRAAAEGVVLLKNDGLLPLSADAKLVIFGDGIGEIIKGGTGSGDVNVRGTVSVLEGLKAAGYLVINEENAALFRKETVDSRNIWAERVKAKLASMESGSDFNFLDVLYGTPAGEIHDLVLDEKEIASADAVIYVLSRTAGEAKDRDVTEGDFYFTQKEKQEIGIIKAVNPNIVLVINSGGQVDLAEEEADPAVRSIVYLSQPGMEAGHVLADVISGKVVPSGHLTTTWARRYEDFPNAAVFSHMNGDTTNEFYHEGIYVGYRYFDSFGVKTLYPFGFGLSYTKFEVQAETLQVQDQQITLGVKVTNIGDSYSGKQVVQVYAACPQEKLPKEAKRLIGFSKTKVLAPGESQCVEITADAKQLASYVYDKAAWVVERGEYGILIGTSAEEYFPAGIIQVAEDAVIEEVSHILPTPEGLQEIVPDGEAIRSFTERWREEAKERKVPVVVFAPERIKNRRHEVTDLELYARKLAQQMTDEELVYMVMGEMTKGQDNIIDNELVTTGIFVPGAAGETSCRFEEKFSIPAISMADGPAGIRVVNHYDVDNETGLIYGMGLTSAMDGGILAPHFDRENVTTYHMYATAIPVGTLLAQSWNPDILQEIGVVVAEEMLEFNVAWWLAPGMCIHRNPLCGRNFEYYSEDPLIAGTMAAAITRGVQSLPGVGTTIKHFACNNQEDNRMFSNSILSERALREIYIRGFEIAVKTSQPMCMMSSYNQINGVPAANNTDLITTVVRGEWDFKGVVMTDWTTTTSGSAVSFKCMEAGNDLIMPGHQKDVDNISAALADGTLDRGKLVDCAARIINILLQTIGMEDPKPYC